MKKFTLTMAMAATLLLAAPAPAFSMHITEGILPPLWCLSWGALTLPFIVAGFFSIKKKVAGNPKYLLLLALCGAFAFMLSALKIPSVTGSCSHPTGAGLSAILFGPTATAVLGLIALIFQALLLAHGGITTLGANVFSMGIVGPFVSYAAYRLAKKAGCGLTVSVFLAAFLGDICTYIVTSIQLALAFPDNGSIVLALGKFMSIFALTQLPLAVCEGLVTVAVFNVLEKYSHAELTELAII